MKTIYVQVQFEFVFEKETDSTMTATYVGNSDVSEDIAIMKAWLKMANDNFDRNLILKTKEIKVKDIKVL